MKNQKSMVIAGTIILVIVAAIIFAVTNKKVATTNTPVATNSSSSTTAEAPVTNVVTISSFAFSPASITVKAGTTVTWTNNDSANHTVTANTPSADAPSSDTLAKGKTYSVTFNKAGTYAYYCAIHTEMTGTVIVTE